MKRSRIVLLAGIGLGVAAYLVLRNIARPKRLPNIELKTQDLDYPDLSPTDLISNHLTDLNQADRAHLLDLGLMLSRWKD